MSDDYLLAKQGFYEGFRDQWLLLRPTWNIQTNIRWGAGGAITAFEPWLKVIFADLDTDNPTVGFSDEVVALGTVDCFSPKNDQYDDLEADRLAGDARRALLAISIPGLFYRKMWKRDFGLNDKDYWHSRVSVACAYDPGFVG